MSYTNKVSESYTNKVSDSPAAVVEAIQKAFAAVKAPPLRHLFLKGWPGTRRKWTEFRDLPWQKLPPDVLADFHFYLNDVRPQSWTYLCPAYLCALLNRELVLPYRYRVAETVLSVLTPHAVATDRAIRRLARTNPTSAAKSAYWATMNEAHHAGLEGKLAWYASLDAAQSAVVARALRLIPATPDLEFVVLRGRKVHELIVLVRAALEQYWARYLPGD